MRSRAVTLLLLAAAAPAVLLGASKCYDVAPFQNCVMQAQPDEDVTQTIVMTVDSLTKVSVWIGDTFEGGVYQVEVKDGATVVASKYNVEAKGLWQWLDFDLDQDVAPVRGKTYKVVVSRAGGAPISFGYDSTSPYDYGYLSVGSDSGLDGQMVGA